MSEGKKAKYTKIGAVLKKSNGKKGVFIVTGNPSNPKEEYRTSVELIVRDSTGKEIARGTNLLLNVQDPRQRPGISEEQREKIPATLVSELYLVQDSE